eukprot:gene13783-19691_t
MMVKTMTMGVQLFTPMAILSMAVLLPVHLSGNYLVDASGASFMKATLTNVEPGSPLLWIHFVFISGYLIYTCWLLKWHYQQFVIVRQHYMKKGDTVNIWRHMHSTKTDRKSSQRRDEMSHNWKSTTRASLSKVSASLRAAGTQISSSVPPAIWRAASTVKDSLAREKLQRRLYRRRATDGSNVSLSSDWGGAEHDSSAETEQGPYNGARPHGSPASYNSGTTTSGGHEGGQLPASATSYWSRIHESSVFNTGMTGDSETGSEGVTPVLLSPVPGSGAAGDQDTSFESMREKSPTSYVLRHAADDPSFYENPTRPGGGPHPAPPPAPKLLSPSLVPESPLASGRGRAVSEAPAARMNHVGPESPGRRVGRMVPDSPIGRMSFSSTQVESPSKLTRRQCPPSPGGRSMRVTLQGTRRESMRIPTDTRLSMLQPAPSLNLARMNTCQVDQGEVLDLSKLIDDDYEKTLSKKDRQRKAAERKHRETLDSTGSLDPSITMGGASGGGSSLPSSCGGGWSGGGSHAVKISPVLHTLREGPPTPHRYRKSEEDRPTDVCPGLGPKQLSVVHESVSQSAGLGRRGTREERDAQLPYSPGACHRDGCTDAAADIEDGCDIEEGCEQDWDAGACDRDNCTDAAADIDDGCDIEEGCEQDWDADAAADIDDGCDIEEGCEQDWDADETIDELPQWWKGVRYRYDPSHAATYTRFNRPSSRNNSEGGGLMHAGLRRRHTQGHGVGARLPGQPTPKRRHVHPVNEDDLKAALECGLLSQPSVRFRKTINAVDPHFGEVVAVNAQLYTVLVTDVNQNALEANKKLWKCHKSGESTRWLSNLIPKSLRSWLFHNYSGGLGMRVIREDDKRDDNSNKQEGLKRMTVSAPGTCPSLDLGISGMYVVREDDKHDGNSDKQNGMKRMPVSAPGTCPSLDLGRSGHELEAKPPLPTSVRASGDSHGQQSPLTPLGSMEIFRSSTHTVHWASGAPLEEGTSPFATAATVDFPRRMHKKNLSLVQEEEGEGEWSMFENIDLGPQAQLQPRVEVPPGLPRASLPPGLPAPPPPPLPPRSTEHGASGATEKLELEPERAGSRAGTWGISPKVHGASGATQEQEISPFAAAATVGFPRRLLRKNRSLVQEEEGAGSLGEDIDLGIQAQLRSRAEVPLGRHRAPLSPGLPTPPPPPLPPPPPPPRLILPTDSDHSTPRATPGQIGSSSWGSAQAGSTWRGTSQLQHSTHHAVDLSDIYLALPEANDAATGYVVVRATAATNFLSPDSDAFSHGTAVRTGAPPCTPHPMKGTRPSKWWGYERDALFDGRVAELLYLKEYSGTRPSKWWGYVRAAVFDGRVAELLYLKEYSVVTATFKSIFKGDFERAIPVIRHKAVDKLLMRMDREMWQWQKANLSYKRHGKRPIGAAHVDPDAAGSKVDLLNYHLFYFFKCRPRCCGCCGPRVDLLNYHRSNLEELNMKVQDARREALCTGSTPSWFVFFKTQHAAVVASQSQHEALCTGSTPSWFVFFKTQHAAVVALQLQVHGEDNHEFKVRLAPGPEEVNWSALWMSYRDRDLRGWFLTPLLVFLVLIPVGVFSGALMQLDYLLCPSNSTQLDSGLDGRSWGWYCKHENVVSWVLSKVITGWLPALLLALWQGMILPLLLYIFVQATGRCFSLSQLDQGIGAWFFHFQVWNSFLGGVLGSAITQTINQLVETGPSEIFNLVGNYLPASSNFFVNVLMFRGLVAVPMRMVVPHLGVRFYVFRRWLRFSSTPLTERDKAFLYAPTSVRYGAEFGNVLGVFLIGLAFSVISPIIPVICVFVFIMMWLLWRYTLLYVYIRKYESGGLMWPFLFTRLVYFMLITVFFTTCVFIVKKAYVQAFLLLLLAPLGLLNYTRYINLRFQQGIGTLPLSYAAKAPHASVDPLVYIPPPLNAKALGWHPEWTKPWSGWNLPAYSF